MICRLTGSRSAISHAPERPGDVKHSLANIAKARKLLDYEPKHRVDEGLELALDWYKANQT
jgi:UDP-N-acetylglucosamine 4-epimerase